MTEGVRAQVYDSLAKEGSGFPPQKLAYFDVEGGEDLLHEMRFLAVAARPASAEYIVDGGLDAVVRLFRRQSLLHADWLAGAAAAAWPGARGGCGEEAARCHHGWADASKRQMPGKGPWA